MTELVADLAGPHRAASADDAVPLPPPVAFDAPVLIGDCATPLSGSTVLALLWQKLDGTPPLD